MRKCVLQIEMYGEGEVLVHAQDCHHEATHYFGDSPVCLGHTFSESNKKELLTIDEYQYQRIIRALAADDEQVPRKVDPPRPSMFSNRKRS